MAERAGRQVWPGAWIQAVLAALGGSSVVGAFVYAAGWLMAAHHAKLLGLPEDMLPSPEARTYEVALLLVNWPVCAVVGPCMSGGQVAPLFVIAATSLVMWLVWGLPRTRKWGGRWLVRLWRTPGWLRVERGPAQRPRRVTPSVSGRSAGRPDDLLGASPGPQGLLRRLRLVRLPVALAFALAVCLALAVGIQGSLPDLIEASDLLAESDRFSRFRTFSQTIEVPSVGLRTRLLPLLAEGNMALYTSVLGNVVLAVLAQLAWTYTVLRLLSIWAQKWRGPARSLVWMTAATTALAAALSVWFLVRLQALMLPLDLRPLMHEEDHCLAYLGSYGGLSHFYDCDTGLLERREGMPTQKECQWRGRVNLIRAAFLSIGPAGHWSFNRADPVTVADTGVLAPRAALDGDVSRGVSYGAGRVGNAIRCRGESRGVVIRRPGKRDQTRQAVELLDNLSEVTLQAWVKRGPEPVSGPTQTLLMMGGTTREPALQWTIGPPPAEPGIRWRRPRTFLQITTHRGNERDAAVLRGEGLVWDPDEWHLLTATLHCDGRQCMARFYRDGMRVGYETVAGSFQSGPFRLTIGSDGMQGIDGWVDEVKLWTCAMTSREVRRQHEKECECAEALADADAGQSKARPGIPTLDG